MKKLLLLPLMLVFALGCAPWYKNGVPAREVPKYEREQDKAYCERYARSQCTDPEYFDSRIGYTDKWETVYIPATRDWDSCFRYNYLDCVYQLGWYQRSWSYIKKYGNDYYSN
jgi:hypothetical protein